MEAMAAIKAESKMKAKAEPKADEVAKAEA